ncbi:MAG: hypothetical protein Fur0037_29340 [Planctomycetota bacterium]
MRAIDWIVFFAFLAYVVWDGVRRHEASSDLEGYFAGGRGIPWWAAGLSIMATQASAITVIGTTGQGHEHGMDFVQTYFGLPFAMVLLCIFLVPLYRSRPILTPYEYLEERFGPVTRTIASAIFLMSRCLALGVVIYAPSVALSAMIGLQTWESVIVIGSLTTLYTAVGGVSAVIWTDVKQMIVILLGLLFVLFVLLRDLLPTFSFGQILDLAGAAGKLNALEVAPEHSGLWPRTLEQAAAGAGTPSFWEEKYNVWSGLFGGLFLHLSYFGCDHSQAQRLLTSPDARQSRLSLLLSAFAKVPMQALVLFLGVLMWLFYSVHGQPLLYKASHVANAARAEIAPRIAETERRFEEALAARRRALDRLASLPDGPRSDPAALREYQGAVRAVAALRREARVLAGERIGPGGRPIDDPDTNDIFCRFILDNLPPVVLGLVIAAIFAAAMSSIDSTLNALSAATVVDFYRRWAARGAGERRALFVGKILTMFWGALATFLALFFAGGGSVIERINEIGSLFYGSLLGIFALGLFVPGAGGRAGAIGLCCGMALVLLVSRTLKIEFLWYNVIGCFGVICFGSLAALFDRFRRLA